MERGIGADNHEIGSSRLGPLTRARRGAAKASFGENAGQLRAQTDSAEVKVDRDPGS